MEDVDEVCALCNCLDFSLKCLRVSRVLNAVSRPVCKAVSIHLICFQTCSVFYNYLLLNYYTSLVILHECSVTVHVDFLQLLSLPLKKPVVEYNNNSYHAIKQPLFSFFVRLTTQYLNELILQ